MIRGNRKAVIGDARLDQLMSAAQTPRVPDDLARRIVAEVTRLPQQPPMSAAQDGEERGGGWRRKVALGAIMATLCGFGAAGLLLHGNDGAQSPRPLVADAAPADSVPEVEDARLAAETIVPAHIVKIAKAVHPHSHPVAQAPAEAAQPNPPAPAAEDTSPATPAPSPAPANEPAVLAQQEVQAPVQGAEDDGVGPLPVYGPPVSQGFGIVGGRPATSSPGHASGGGLPPPPPR